VMQIRGRIDKGNVEKYQVTIKVGFTHDREEE
jgi:dodecin